MPNLHDPESTDVSLAQAWAAGDERAYDALVTRYAPMVYRRCRRAVGEMDADDATQAVFLVLAQKREQAAASPVLAAWLMTVAGNVVRNALRDRLRRRNAEMSVPHPIPSPAETSMHGIEEHLDACLAELPVKEREAVQLHHLAGHTLAEVSQQTGSGLSTVRYRIERGLERLRTLLAKRGVALSSLALVAVLASEAQAAVPADVMTHLYDLKPAAGGAGSTAGPSDRIQRWSRQSSSTMTRIVLTSAGLLLLGGGAWQILPSTESGAADPAVMAPMVTQEWKSSGHAFRDLDPLRARRWIIIRANDGARIAKSLQWQPEMMLLPAGQNAWLERCASLREAVLVVDSEGEMTNDERVALYRYYQELYALPPDDRFERMMVEVRRTTDEAKSAATRGNAAKELVDGLIFTGTITGNAPDAKILQYVSSLLDDQPTLLGSKAVGSGAWTYTTPIGPGAVTWVDHRIAFNGPAEAVAVPAQVLNRKERHGKPAPALEFDAILDQGRPGAAPVTTASGSLNIDRDGLHFEYRTDVDHDEEPGAALDRRCFSRVPGEAIMAAGFALHQRVEGKNLRCSKMVASFQRLLQDRTGKAMPAAAAAAFSALGMLFDKADGTVLAWIEPGSILPSLTMEVDVAKHDAEAVIAASGLTQATDGSASTVVGPVLITLGWLDGHFVATTHPKGMQSFRHGGGFDRHPEIQRDLATITSGNIDGCVLLRPVAYLDLVQPFMAMARPDLQHAFDDYRHALAKGPGYAFLTHAITDKKATVEARGVLAIACCVFLGYQAQNPIFPLGVAN